MDKAGRLIDFFVERFSAEELERFLLCRPNGTHLLAALPDPEEGLAHFAEKAVLMLARRGLLDADFFAALVHERPRLEAEISALADLWRPVFTPPVGRQTPRWLAAALLLAGALGAAGYLLHRGSTTTGDNSPTSGAVDDESAHGTATIPPPPPTEPQAPAAADGPAPSPTNDMAATADNAPPVDPGQQVAQPLPRAEKQRQVSAPAAVALDPVVICFSSQGQAVGAQHAFRTGERISLKVQSPGDGYLSMLNISPDGRASMLYPWSGENNRVAQGQEIRLPPTGTFAFEEPSGPEQVVLLWSPQPTASSAEIQALATRLKPNAKGQEWSSAAPNTQGVKALVRQDDVGASHCSRFVPQGTGEALLVQLQLTHSP